MVVGIEAPMVWRIRGFALLLGRYVNDKRNGDHPGDDQQHSQPYKILTHSLSLCAIQSIRSSLTQHSPDVRLARPQRDQSLVAGIGDGDNSLSMRWVKLGSTGCMNHADGAGGGRHVAATG